MSTHAMIARRRSDGMLDVTYCHFDGYPAGVGQVLIDNLAGESAARREVFLGLLFSAPNGWQSLAVAGMLSFADAPDADIQPGHYTATMMREGEGVPVTVCADVDGVRDLLMTTYIYVIDLAANTLEVHTGYTEQYLITVSLATPLMLRAAIEKLGNMRA